MGYTNMGYAVEGPIATINFNRPDVMNAITPELEAELHRAFDEADDDPAVRVIILTGSGNAFSAGYDMGSAERQASGTKPSDPTGKSIGEFIAHWQRNDAANIEKLMHLWRLSKPVIGAVNGWAMGGGFWYQLATDITIASDRAVFAQPEVRHISNTTLLFALLCGWKVANRFAITGDHFDAQEALRIGMINEVVPHDELMPRARELAERIAMVPEASVRMNKAVAMMGLQASGAYAGMLLNGALSAIVHSSFGPERERLFEAQQEHGMRGYLDARDGPFLPEPFGPKSRVKE
jgi:enoyl-CoA hydratase/carnithine racemase